MPLDLTIPCPKAFRGVELVIYGERALRDLLDLTFRPSLRVWHKQGSVDTSLGLDEDLGDGMPLLGIGMAGVQESIQLVYYRIDHAADWIPPEERGFRAGIAASEEELAWGGAVRLALGAGMALGLARLQGTPIIDHKLSLTHTERQDAEQFFRALQVRGPFHDMRSAAEALFLRTPLKEMNGGRLRILEIERDVDGMMMDLLGPLRMRHAVDPQAFERFFALADEWLLLAETDRDMASKLEGVLVLVKEFLLDESRKFETPEEILKMAAETEWRLEKLRPVEPPSPA